MNKLKLLGIVLIVIGAIGLATKGFSFTRNKEVLKIGDFSAKADVRERVNIPPWVSFVLIGAGVALLVVPTKGK